MGVLSQYPALIKRVEEGIIIKNKHLNNFKDDLKKVSDADWKDVQDILLACIQTRESDVIKSVALPILDKRKLIQWKDHQEIFKSIFDNILKYGKMSLENIHYEIHAHVFVDFMEKVVALLKSIQCFKTYVEEMKTITTAAFSNRDNVLMRIYCKYGSALPYTQHTQWVLETFDLIYDQIQQYPKMKRDDDWASLLSLWLTFVFRDSSSNGKQALKYASHVASLFNYCKKQEWVDPYDSDKRTVHWQVCKDILVDYACRHTDKKEILAPIFEAVKDLWECEDEGLRQVSNNLITLMPGGMLVELDESIAELLIDNYVNGEDLTTIGNIQGIYRSHPGKFSDKLEDIAEAMDGAEDGVVTSTISLFGDIAKHDAALVTDKCIMQLVDTLERVETYGIGLNSLLLVAEKFPHKLEKYEKELEESLYTHKVMASQASNIFVHMSNGSEKKTEKYFPILMKASKKVTESMHHYGYLYAFKQMGSDFPHLLAKHENYFKSFENDAMLKDVAQGLIDIIHGRSLAAVSKDVKVAQEDIENIDERMTNTEDHVENLSREVDDTKKGVVVLSGEVNQQGERLGELEDVVEETVEKVEEIDKKTLSHAPKWSRDVAVLLNVESDHDWRLLASRLGYSNDDIRNWATQPDPCLSMFDEWFATNKTREATHAILKNIEEMNRTDAAMIVENALKQTEDTVEDEEVDYVTPPPVFLSYQWGVQEEAKLLKKHLEMAGFECWMDIGQMGGGDKLFEKIDTGIRAAKIVICCVTEKYAKSANCNREVNLSVNLGKPIIPLLVEKMSWPPAGSMGPIFGEYLFIRFFARAGETAGDIRYWPTAKFQELLMQLRYSVIPNGSMISDPYKDWWSPTEEIIHIKPKDTNSTAVVKSEEPKGDPDSPDVFISYQWGKQPQIKALYKTLTLMGFRCWLDILQMGGGDSLYDKIDKGVRGCKVVLTCVTTKYSLSANCRREVSLADALKKPIVPLLLEKITWPPEGPMSMVFTQLLYINFCKPDISVQETWDCQQMEELLSKMNAHIPSMVNSSREKDDQVVESKTKKKEAALPPAKDKVKEVNNVKNSSESKSTKYRSNTEEITEKDTTEKMEKQPKEERQDQKQKSLGITTDKVENHVNDTSTKQGDNNPKPQSDNNQSPQSKEPNGKSSSCIVL